MNLDKKWKIFVIVIVIILIGFFIWYFWFRDQSQIDITSEKRVETISEITKINPISLVYIDNENKIRFIAEGNKKIVEYDLGKNEERELYVINEGFIEKAIWSPNHKHSLLKITENSQTFYRYLNLESSKIKDLDNSIDSPVFSPNSSKIACWYFDEKDNNTISIANPDGSNLETIYKLANLYETKIALYWPKDDKLYYSLVYITESHPSDLYKLDLNSSSSKPQKIVDEFWGIYENKDKNLTLLSADDGLGVFDFNKKKFSKFAKQLYNINGFYYLGENSVLVSAASNKDQTTNSVYLIDLQKVKWQRIFDPINIEKLKDKIISNVFYSQKNKELFFTIKNSLYKIKLDLSKYLK